MIKGNYVLTKQGTNALKAAKVKDLMINNVTEVQLKKIKRYGLMIILDDLEQGTTEWLIARLAVITASRAAEFSQPPSLAPMPDVEIVKDGKINRCEFKGQVFEHSNKLELAKLVRASLPPVYSDMRNGYMNELIGQVCTGEIKEQVKFKQAEWGHENEPGRTINI